MATRQPGEPRWRAYTDQERATATGLALAIGAKNAAGQLGIPRRTISSWLRRPTPGVEAAIVASESAVVDKLWRAVTEGIDLVTAGLRDPRARLGDKARALDVLANQHALLSGRVTSRTAVVDESEGITAEDADRLADWLEQRLFEGHDPDEILAAVRPQLPSGPSDVG